MIQPDSAQSWLDFQFERLISGRLHWSLPAAVRVRHRQTELVLDGGICLPLDQVDTPGPLTAALGLTRLRAVVEAIEAAFDDLFDWDQLGLTSDQILIDPSTGSAHLLAFPWQTHKTDKSAVDASPEAVASPQRQLIVRLLQSIDQAYSMSLAIEPLAEQLLAYDFSAFFAALGDDTVKILKTEKPAKTNRAPWMWIGLHVLLVGGFALSIAFRAPVFLNGPGSGQTWPDSFADSWSGWIILAALILLMIDLRLLVSDDYPVLKQRLGRALAGLPTQMKKAGQSISTAMQSKRASNRGSQKHRPSVDPEGLTELMIPDRVIYRLGLLSAGKPGTPEEMEGLRAYILVDEFVIGRDEFSCDLLLPDTSVGRRHARISRREGSFFIMDLGSKNGTSLDGRRLNKLEDYPLPDRCQLSFADQAFYFCAD